MSNNRKQAVIDAGIFPAVIRDLFPSMQATGREQALVCCPFHQDESPSLSVNLSAGLHHCFACGAEGNGFDLYMQVRDCDFKTALHDLEARAGISTGTRGATSRPSTTSTMTNDRTPKITDGLMVKPKVVATFYYHDADGKRRYWKKRFEPGFDGKRKKSFAVYHKDECGKEVKGRNCDPLLYNTHKLANNPPGEPVFFLEGERKADILTAWGLCATSLDSGGQSGKTKTTWRDEFNNFFAGREVYILPDNDTAGETYAATIAERLTGLAAAIRVLRLPGLPEKGDICDWIKLQECAA